MNGAEVTPTAGGIDLTTGIIIGVTFFLLNFLAAIALEYFKRKNGSSRTTDSQTNYYTTTLASVALNSKSAADALIRLEQSLVRKFDNIHKHIDDSEDRMMEKIDKISPNAGD